MSQTLQPIKETAKIESIRRHRRLIFQEVSVKTKPSDNKEEF